MLKVHHIGYLVKDIEISKLDFLKLGYSEVSPIVHDKARKIRICFMENADVMVELVEPCDDCEFLKGLKKKIGVGTYHICYECDNFDNTIQKLTSNNGGGYILIQEPSPAVAIGNRRVVFMFSPNVGLIELVEIQGA